MWLPTSSSRFGAARDDNVHEFVGQFNHLSHTANGSTSLPTAMTWRKRFFIRSGCADVFPRATPTVDAPCRILTGSSRLKKSAYCHRSTIVDSWSLRSSNTSAQVLLVICPVTGLMPMGSLYHFDRSCEYSSAASEVLVGTAPPGEDGARNAQSRSPKP